MTKPIGTGLLATGLKRSDPLAIGSGGDLEACYRAAVTEMTRLNDIAARVALAAGATGATDVTGFGLLGHLHKMAFASDVQARVHVEAVPLLPDVHDLLDAGFIPGGTARNLESVEDVVDGGSDDDRMILADAQTSGGLLIAVEAARAEELLAALHGRGVGATAIVGRVRGPGSGRIFVEP